MHASDRLNAKSPSIWFYPTKIFLKLTAPCNDTFKRQTKLMTNKLSCYEFSIKWITIIVPLIVSLTCLKLVRSNIELSNVPWVVEIITILTTILTMSALNAENDDFGDHWWSKHLGSSELSASFFVTCNTLLASLQYVFWCLGLKIQNAKYLLLFVFVFDVLDWTFKKLNIYCYLYLYLMFWIENLKC